MQEAASSRLTIVSPGKRDLILENTQSPGDIVMLTAAVRDLHRHYSDRFRIDVATSSDQIWLHNPHLSKFDRGVPSVTRIKCHYPLIHQADARPLHFIHGFALYLESKLGVRIPITEFKGDIHFSEAELKAESPVKTATRYGGPYWVMIAGGKYDYTCKYWPTEFYQKVVDHFAGRIVFVQCGERLHYHPRLNGVIDMVGCTDTRQFLNTIYHADGVVCPVTFAMHAAAAVPRKFGYPPLKPCVVISGGREPAHWEQYPGHQFLQNVGTLPCCAHGGCWKSRCQKVGDGSIKDVKEICLKPVKMSNDVLIPKCMVMIKPDDVIKAIETYYEGGVLSYKTKEYAHERKAVTDTRMASNGETSRAVFSNMPALSVR